MLWIRVHTLKSDLGLNLDLLVLISYAVSLSDGDNVIGVNDVMINVLQMLNRMPGSYHKFNKL